MTNFRLNTKRLCLVGYGLISATLILLVSLLVLRYQLHQSQQTIKALTERNQVQYEYLERTENIIGKDLMYSLIYQKPLEGDD